MVQPISGLAKDVLFGVSRPGRDVFAPGVGDETAGRGGADAGIEGHQITGHHAAAGIACAAQARSVHFGPRFEVIEAADLIPDHVFGDIFAQQNRRRAHIHVLDGRIVAWKAVAFDAFALAERIDAQRRDALRAKQFADDGLLVSSNPQNGYIGQYDLKVDAGDNAILVFSDIRNSTDTISNPFAYKISSTGQFLWGANGVTLTNQITKYQVWPKVAPLSDGSYAIVWWFINSSEKNSWFIENSDVQSIVKGLESIKNAKYSRSEVAATVRHLSSDIIAQQYVDFFKEIIKHD